MIVHGVVKKSYMYFLADTFQYNPMNTLNSLLLYAFLALIEIKMIYIRTVPETDADGGGISVASRTNL